MNTERTNIVEDRILVTLRQIAWERAKVDLPALLSWFLEEPEYYKELLFLISDFIGKVEQGSPLT